MENFCRVRAETIETLAIFRPVTKNLPTKRPRFGVQKWTPKWRPLIQSQFDLLVSGRLGPRFGVRFWTPKRGPFVGKIFAAGRKIVQVSIVSAGTRQKFRIPLCHWVPMVLQRREQLFSTPCERLCPHMLELGRPTLATLESTAFLALGFGAVNGQDFRTRRDPLGRFTLFLISQLVSGSRVSLTQGRAGPAGVETAGREHGSCNHAVGE